MRKGSTSFGACEVWFWRWLFGSKIPVSLTGWGSLEERMRARNLLSLSRISLSLSPLSVASLARLSGVEGQTTYVLARQLEVPVFGSTLQPFVSTVQSFYGSVPGFRF